MQLQISFQGLPHSEALQQAIADKAARLGRYYEHIVSCRVVVEAEARHKQQGKLYAVRIDLKVPGGEVAVTRQEDEDVQVAVRDAFDAARRRLEDYSRKQRGDVKEHSQPKA